MAKPTLGFIGAGVTGTALASQLWQQGYNVVAVSSRSLASASNLASRIGNCSVSRSAQGVADLAEAVFITTPDDIIVDIANSLAWHENQLVIHCSGVHSTDILQAAQQYGAKTCCMHPLQTFADIEEAVRSMPGSTFAVEGDEEGLPIVREMVEALKGNIVELKAGDKVLYHAAAVTLSNYLVTLVKTAADLWGPLGIQQDQAVKAMLPLLKGTVNNIERLGIPRCLTGPVARGDVETIKKHIAALKDLHPDYLNLYRAMGLQTIPIALAKGRLSVETSQEIRSTFQTQEPLAEIQSDLSSQDIVAMMNRH